MGSGRVVGEPPPPPVVIEDVIEDVAEDITMTAEAWPRPSETLPTLPPERILLFRQGSGGDDQPRSKSKSQPSVAAETLFQELAPLRSVMFLLALWPIQSDSKGERWGTNRTAKTPDHLT